MKNKDVLRLFGHNLLIEFGATGETGSITALPLDRGLRLAFESNSIHAHFPDGDTKLLIERFASETLGRAAYQDLQAALRRYVRHARIRNCLKKLTLWVAAPMTALLLALTLNVAVTRGMNGAAAAPSPLAAAPSLIPALASATATQNHVPPISPNDIARAMRDGVKTGKFSIRLSTDNKPPLYIFSDPACNYCRQLEPELDMLAKSHTIHLFPVSVIGGAGSRTRLSALLCGTPDQRLKDWKMLIAGNAYTAPACDAGDMAIKANDSIFSTLGFGGTPTIVSANGDQYPPHLPNTYAAISAWLQSPKP